MTSNHYTLVLIPLIFIFFYATSSRALVPANETFYFVNQGEFGDRIIEYDASYRVIRNGSITFYTYPFRLCFYNTTPDKYIFAIRAGIPNDESLMRWVWDANRNNPVGENATLTFGRDGNFVLAEADGRIAWQTNTANKGVTGARMLPNGNFVLYGKNGKYVWQSFDYPTDTLLVGMSLHLNGRNKLISRKSEMDGSDGPYSLVVKKGEEGIAMYINKTGEPLIYGGWLGQAVGPTVTFNALSLDDNSTAYELVLTINQDQVAGTGGGGRRRLMQVRPIRSGGELNLNKVNYNATLSFLRLSADGNLRAFTYYSQVSYLKWEETFAFFSTYFVRRCGLPSYCNNFGICDRGMCIACPSPKGLLGWSNNCAPPKVPSCRGGTKGGDYYKVVGVEHFMSPYTSSYRIGPMKVEQCKERCSSDCKCLGFIYNESSSRCLIMPLIETLIKVDNSTSVGYIKYSK